MARKGQDTVERLFVVSQPNSFPDEIMQDAFCRFGGLIDAHFMNGKVLMKNFLFKKTFYAFLPKKLLWMYHRIRFTDRSFYCVL